MALFKSQEDRELEAQQRLADERREADRQRQLRESAAEEARRAELDASPLARARVAHDRGDRFFQAELVVSSLTEVPSSFGASGNAMTRSDDSGDLLGRIEDLGWRLEHTGFTFVQTGTTALDRMTAVGQGMVGRGLVIGVYLFRRIEPPTA